LTSIRRKGNATMTITITTTTIGVEKGNWPPSNMPYCYLKLSRVLPSSYPIVRSSKSCAHSSITFIFILHIFYMAGLASKMQEELKMLRKDSLQV
jgi:hypothetical protein